MKDPIKSFIKKINKNNKKKISYEEVIDIIESIAKTHRAKKFGFMTEEDIESQVRLICIQQIKFFDITKESDITHQKSLERWLNKIVKNRLKKDTWLEIILSRPAYGATFVTTKLFNFFYNKKFTDIIGARLYKREKIIKVPFDYNNASFDFAFVSRMAKMGLKMTEVNVGYKFRKFGTSGMRWYHLFEAIVAMIKVKFL